MVNSLLSLRISSCITGSVQKSFHSLNSQMPAHQWLLGIWSDLLCYLVLKLPSKRGEQGKETHPLNFFQMLSIVLIFHW